MTVEELAQAIQDDSPGVRTEAWRAAAEMGAAAIEPLERLAQHSDFEVRRAAVRGMWAVVRHAGRPGAEDARREVCAALMAVLARAGAVQLRRDVLWMISELAGDEQVPRMAALLNDAELREDARAALERVPGQASLAALEAALADAPEDFKPSLAQGLRARGVETPGIPSAKLTPVYPSPEENFADVAE